MRVLTIRQPWADYVLQLRGGKDIENRTWKVEPQRIAVHAGQQMWDGPESVGEEWRPRGVILGTVTVTGCHRVGSLECVRADCLHNVWAGNDNYHAGSLHRRMYHWTLDHPRPFPNPIPAVGKMGLWTPDPDLADAIRAAEDAALAEGYTGTLL